MGLGQILSARDGDWYIVPPATPRMRVLKGFADYNCDTDWLRAILDFYRLWGECHGS